MLEVRIVQGLTTEQRDILLGWSDDVFGTKHLEWHGRKKDWSVLGFVDGHLVSHVGVLKDEVHVAGEPVWVGGIGAVITIPSAQHNGYAHALLQHSVAFIRDELDMQFGLLFCLPRLISFYERRRLAYGDRRRHHRAAAGPGGIASHSDVLHLPYPDAMAGGCG